MALTADYTKIEGWDSLTDEETIVRDALVWVSMAVGIREITEANAREFYARVSLWEKINGGYRIGPEGRICFTPNEVRRFVGLSTNVSPLTKSKFLNQLYDSHDRFNVRWK